MPTAQERYDIERNREINNVPLLTILKAQIDKSYNAVADIAQIRLELQAASNLEDWDEYAKLLDKLSHIEEVIDVTGEVQIEVLPGSVPNVTDELLAKGNSDTDAVRRANSRLRGNSREYYLLCLGLNIHIELISFK